MMDLKLSSGMASEARWALGERPLIIGRDSGCDIVLDDPAVSRKHSMIQLCGGSLILKDLCSRNKTFVNDRPVEECTLEMGDQVRIGRATFFIVGGEARQGAKSGVKHEPASTLPADKAPEPVSRKTQSKGRDAKNKAARLGELIGVSAEIVHLRQLIGMAAAAPQPVLICGETGTGKDLVAKLLHGLSERADKLMVVVNCAAIAKDLFESELFGYEHGAFTGAKTGKSGLMEVAGSTLFLDEIGDLSPDNQAKILRALETRCFRRIGGIREIQTDFRLIAATNKDLQAAMREGTFRVDLYHRLRGIEILIPPLRERVSDIPPLAEHFLSLQARGTGDEKHLSREGMAFLLSCPWPGNVRELKNTVETAALYAGAETVELANVSEACEHHPVFTNTLTLAETEKRCIVQALGIHKGRIDEAAAALGIGRSTLYNKLSEYGFGHRAESAPTLPMARVP